MKPATFTARVADLVARADWPPVRMWEDAPDKRIKIQFRALPDTETCELMKKYGFRFVGGPAQYWVRRLDTRGRAAAAELIAKLEKPAEAKP